MQRHDTVGERRKGYLTDRRTLRIAVGNASKVQDGEPIRDIDATSRIDAGATVERVVGSTVLGR